MGSGTPAFLVILVVVLATTCSASDDNSVDSLDLALSRPSHLRSVLVSDEPWISSSPTIWTVGDFDSGPTTNAPEPQSFDYSALDRQIMAESDRDVSIQDVFEKMMQRTKLTMEEIALRMNEPLPMVDAACVPMNIGWIPEGSDPNEAEDQKNWLGIDEVVGELNARETHGLKWRPDFIKDTFARSDEPHKFVPNPPGYEKKKLTAIGIGSTGKNTYKVWTQVGTGNGPDSDRGSRQDSCGQVSSTLASLFCKDVPDGMSPESIGDFLDVIKRDQHELVRCTLGCHSFMVQKRGKDKCHIYQAYMDSDGTSGYNLADGMRHWYNREMKCQDLALKIETIHALYEAGEGRKLTNIETERWDALASNLFYGTITPYTILQSTCTMAPVRTVMANISRKLKTHAKAWDYFKTTGDDLCDVAFFKLDSNF